MTAKINLLNFNRVCMRDYFLNLNEKSFRADQILQWIHQYGISDFMLMSNISRELKIYLTEHTCIEPPEITKTQISLDGTIKWLVKLHDNSSVEMVFIPDKGRGTLCISSQVGCPIQCQFCATGKGGFKRNLTVAEIIGQVWLAARALSDQNKRHDKKITNIVLMGMGEPLLNFDNVVAAVDIMMDDLAYGLSKYRVTLSTSGVVPNIYKLAEVSDVSLAVSLHAPNDKLRDQLVPINKKYPLKELMAACQNYFAHKPRRQVSFEYIMINGVNDSLEHAKELIKLLANIRCKVNLIPANKTEFCNFNSSSPEQIELFQKILVKSGINTVVRKTRGADIAAACGQLAGKNK